MVKSMWVGAMVCGFHSTFVYRDQNRVFGNDVHVTDLRGRQDPQKSRNQIPTANSTDQLVPQLPHSFLLIIEEVGSEFTTPHMKELTTSQHRSFQLWEALTVRNSLMVFNRNLMPYNFKQLLMFLFSKATRTVLIPFICNNPPTFEDSYPFPKSSVSHIRHSPFFNYASNAIVLHYSVARVFFAGIKHIKI